MKKEMKDVLAVKDTADLQKLRTEWEQLVELHNAYDKHEVYQRKWTWVYGRDAIAFCRTCGQLMMHKYEYEDSGAKPIYQPLKPQLLGRGGSNWDLGTLSTKDVAMIPVEFRHFVYEQLFWRLGEKDITHDEAVAILSCRDKSVPQSQLRAYSLQVGGAFAYAYAKTYDDFADDLKQATWTNPHIAYKFLLDSKQPLSDGDRIAISKSPDLAYKIAKEIDKAPHPVTRNAAAKKPDLAASYAIEVDKNPDTKTTRGTTLRSVAMRTVTAADKWMEHFKTPPCEADRNARCKTKYGAFMYARDYDKGPHPVTEAGVRGSFHYATRYAYEIKGAPMVGAEEACQSAGFMALEYAMTFNIHNRLLERGAFRNSKAREMYRMFKQEKLHPILSKKEALRKSYWALAYMAVNNCWNDKELSKRANANQLYKWLASNVRKNLASIAKAKARIAAKAAAK
jgi:hypothetical protein